MERKQTKQSLWIFKGKRLKWKGQVLLNGSTFLAYDHEISPTFRDIIHPVSEVEKKELPAIVTEPFIERKPGAWFDVYGWDGEKVNDRNLRKEDAEKLLEIVKNKKPQE